MFKHVSDHANGNIIEGNLSYKEGSLLFYGMNTKELTTPKDPAGGIGLENLKRRLALMYPEKHSLRISDTGSKYEVWLQINLQ